MLFFFNDTATTEIYTLSLHDALPIYLPQADDAQALARHLRAHRQGRRRWQARRRRSEEHTSELQSRLHLVCRLLLEKKKNTCTNSAALVMSAWPSATLRCHVDRVVLQ